MPATIHAGATKDQSLHVAEPASRAIQNGRPPRNEANARYELVMGKNGTDMKQESEPVVANPIAAPSELPAPIAAVGAERAVVRLLLLQTSCSLLAARPLGAWVPGSYLETLLYNVRPANVATLIAPSMSLVAGAFLTTAFTAQRAVSIDLLVALRNRLMTHTTGAPATFARR
jgi:hypothetical protein